MEVWIVENEEVLRDFFKLQYFKIPSGPPGCSYYIKLIIKIERLEKTKLTGFNVQ